ncbi:putative toxin-antitoxin system, toxin component [Leptospira weilii serovar Ranarum str. ICFT]|uniref:Toxin-antitoxin system, toxin component n=1 Tax=Leptospira weilii serovar Ranarum str. ICFT TaxID=1218598 RepID=N1WPA5_9LEPT|nr:putative toxin-antitoxin system, toxin component [Leptospira weilii serovar Ranarum str. ICFT]
MIKKLIIEHKFTVTKSAQKTALNHFGFTEKEILNEIIGLQTSDFYKSMTSHHDHKLWQDVYKKGIMNLKTYIQSLSQNLKQSQRFAAIPSDGFGTNSKIQIFNQNTVIISFKGNENL